LCQKEKQTKNKSYWLLQDSTDMKSLPKCT
jgi:hypothetical protein